MATTADFLALTNKLDFFRRYPVIPHIDAGPSMVARAKGYHSVDKAARVMYGQLEPGTNIPNNLLARRDGNTDGNPHWCRVYAGYTANRFPMFWLPYKQNEAYRVTLNDHRPRPLAGGDADVFLTDAVDGCSVYVDGSRTRPTVYHMNAAAVKHTPMGNPDGAFGTTGDFKKDTLALLTKSEDMNQRFRSYGQVPTAGRATNAPKYVRNDDYMVRDPKQVSALVKEQKGERDTLVAPRRIDHVEVATQGTVFGLRDAGSGEWTFYFQKRLVVIYYHDERKYTPLPRKLTSIGHRMLPLEVSEFWPGGLGHVIVRP